MKNKTIICIDCGHEKRIAKNSTGKRCYDCRPLHKANVLKTYKASQHAKEVAHNNRLQYRSPYRELGMNAHVLHGNGSRGGATMETVYNTPALSMMRG